MMRCLSAICLLLMIEGISIAQEDEATRNRRLKFMVDSVSDVTMKLDSGVELVRKEEALLRWSNPVSGVPDGTVFMWTDHGRPHVAAQVFVVADGTWLQEYQSLSPQAISADRSGRRLWSPNQPGISMVPIPGAPPPAADARRRLIQMRSLVRQYSASDQFEETKPYVLYLQSNPLHRYGEANDDIIDGALFSFTHGTDPELLVLVEAQKTEDQAEWRIGFAPLTSYEVEVTRNGEAIWHCDRRPPPNKITDTFFMHIYDKRF